MDLLLYIPVIKKEEKLLKYISKRLGLENVCKEEIRSKLEELYKNDINKFNEILEEIIYKSIKLRISRYNFPEIMKDLLPSDVYLFLTNKKFLDRYEMIEDKGRSVSVSLFFSWIISIVVASIFEVYTKETLIKVIVFSLIVFVSTSLILIKEDYKEIKNKAMKIKIV